MNVYTVIQDFSAPQLGSGISLQVGDTVGKLASRASVLVGGSQYENQAFYDWVGSTNSQPYLTFVGTLPDPLLPGVPNIRGGSTVIGSGVSSVTLTGAVWDFIPTWVVVTVLKPVGGDNLFATVRTATITADGFTADLSAPTPDVGYSLAYVVLE